MCVTKAQAYTISTQKQETTFLIEASKGFLFKVQRDLFIIRVNVLISDLKLFLIKGTLCEEMRPVSYTRGFLICGSLLYLLNKRYSIETVSLIICLQKGHKESSHD